MKKDAVPTADSLPPPAATAPDAQVVAVAGSPRPPKATKPKGKAPKLTAKKAAPAAAKPAAKPPAKAAAKVAKGAPKLSAMSAAAQVLAAGKEPMNVKQIITAMSEQGLWTSPGGKTPHSTLAAAIGRDINAKGRESKFKKVERGMFAAGGR